MQQYDERLALARKFLDGADDGPMETLRGEMEAASERLEYERAGALRDKLKRLEALRAQFGRLRFAVETLSFVYNVPGLRGRRSRVSDSPRPSARARRHCRRLRVTPSRCSA